MTQQDDGRPDRQQEQGGASEWWRHAVIYQLYVRSFADCDGDGIGDLAGIAGRLDYIAGLGVDAIWLNPCYPSPGGDGGYDVADYLDVDPVYGGLPALEKLLTAAHERGLKVLMDLVPNHCSVAHPWFQDALAAPAGSAARARFHFRDGRGPGGGEPPNNWRSTFGGPAWTRVPGPGGEPGQWYLHSFDASQPDFNWASPEVAGMFDEVLRTWFGRGVDGFRIDVAHAMVKAPGLPELADPAHNPHAWDQPGVHEIFRRWRRVAGQLPLVGEVWLPPERSGAYIRPGELSQVFYFDLLLQPWDPGAFRASITATLGSVPPGGGVPAWTLNNHDVHRSVSRYGLVRAEPMETADDHARRSRARGEVDVALGTRRARAAALLLLALPGAAYLYQGEELGLPEVLDLPGEARRDPIWRRSGGREHGRDGSRVPLPWRAAAPAFGFSPEGSADPWLPQPGWFAGYAVDAEESDPASVLHLYRAALRWRRTLFAGPAALQWLDAGREDVLAFRSGAAISVTVMGAAPFRLPGDWGPVVLASEPCDHDRVLPADATAWVQVP